MSSLVFAYTWCLIKYGARIKIFSDIQNSERNVTHPIPSKQCRKHFTKQRKRGLCLRETGDPAPKRQKDAGKMVKGEPGALVLRPEAPSQAGAAQQSRRLLQEAKVDRIMDRSDQVSNKHRYLSK